MIYMLPNWIAACLCLFMIASYSRHTAGAIDVTYDELIQLNATCVNLDSCQGNRTTDDLRVVNCQCGPICAQLGTCCVDSEYRTLRVDNVNSRIAPVPVLGNDYRVVYLVSGCKPDWDGDEGIKDLCEVSIFDAYRSGDLFPLIPVTNPRNRITYRNYYCFACNEDESSDSPVLWNLNLYNDKNITVGNDPDLSFQRGDYQVKNSTFHIAAEEPAEIASIVNWNRRFVISSCHEKWTDVTTKEKCEAYTALVYVPYLPMIPLYKNPHCAICNGRNVSQPWCSEPTQMMAEAAIIPYGFLLSGIFSFEDKVSRCPRNEVFDKFSKRCRAFRCGRNQKMVKGKCVGNAATTTTRKPSPEGIRGPIASTGRDRPRPPKPL